MSKQRLQLTWYNKDKALIPTETGRYGYSWVDPEDPRYCETHFLIKDDYVEGKQSPKTDDSTYTELADLEPQYDNLLINGESGDVLEALTRVPELAEKYIGNVKLVYIDPPFNTAQAFDSYEDNLEHSIWLTMMRDRLMHLKSLLSEQGFIFVHLDDREVHRMRLLMDEVFGPFNFVAEIAWEKTFKPRNDAQLVSGRHDVILCYRKTLFATLNKLERTAAMNKGYTNQDSDEKGPWTSAPATAPGAKTHQGMVFAIQHPITGRLVYPPIGQCWRFGQDRFLEIMLKWNPNYILQELDDASERASICNVDVADIREHVPALIIPDFDPTIGQERYNSGNWPLVYITSNGTGGFRKKTYLEDMEGRAIEDLWFQDEVGSNDTGKNEIKSLFPGITPFSTPKPEALLKRIIHIGTEPGDIVLDCFAGSGTTAAVAQKMGRRWVTCELLESTFKEFTLPRLTKVVNGEDPGGITKTDAERLDDSEIGLPDGVSPDDANRFTAILNKLIANDDELKNSKSVKKIKSLSKTKKSREKVNWRGGGGFSVAHLSPECFDYDASLDRVLLTENANGETLVKSLAANLGFRLLDDASYFDAVRGDTFLKVIDGVVDEEQIDLLLQRLKDTETVVIAGTMVMDGAREYLRKAKKGSKVIAVPDDVFRYTKGGDLDD